MQSESRRVRPTLLKGLFSLVTLGGALTVGALLMPARSSDAALVVGDNNPDVLFGRDDDNTSNLGIQPSGVAANQSMNNADVLLGESGNDVLVGLLGSDTLVGGPGHDILIGGPEGFVAPNSDVLIGGEGNDINIWAPGDGSDAFVGGPGVDTMVFGVIDRESGRPTGAGPAPGFPVVPSANVTGQPGFCTVERTADGSYEFLVRFFLRATGALAVTVRLSGVERLICTSQVGGQITFADLTAATPQFIIVRRDEIEAADPVLGRIIR